METPFTGHEQVFLKDNNVTVTQSRFVAGGRTYAMRNISSVSIFQIKKSRGLPIVLLVLGIVFLSLEGTRMYGLAIAAGAAFWLYNTKDEYAVRINSNSGEENGFVSPDKSYIQKIVDAVNEAIIFRG